MSTPSKGEMFVGGQYSSKRKISHEEGEDPSKKAKKEVSCIKVLQSYISHSS